ncbi:hypothetical protein R3W88_004209 [Solanum pinnatisectum]|uniref:Uncharacterized protein n=1 Tax=Solanum pinnatisectum TaxID=50273 RepID=A0AAV9K8M2_9SOLN|nr:hypothetical protein R3W88_004209 [Solanum pinnatisectum]
MHGDQDTTPQQSQAAQHTNAEERTGVSKEKQHAKEEKATWKVKDKINSKGNTMHQSKEDEVKQPNNNKKEGAGKFVNFAPNSYALKNLLCINLHSSQNEHEKGNSIMQAGVNEVYEQTKKITHNGHNMEPKIPPPIKVSSNFDIYQPNQQRTNQNSPKQNHNKPPVNNSSIRNTNHQIPDPSPLL